MGPFWGWFVCGSVCSGWLVGLIREIFGNSCQFGPLALLPLFFGSVLLEQFDDFGVAFVFRLVQRTSALAVFYIHIRTFGEKNFYNLFMSSIGCNV